MKIMIFVRIQLQNYENHKKYAFRLRITQIMKFLEFNQRIMKIIEIYEGIMKIIEFYWIIKKIIVNNKIIIM